MNNFKLLGLVFIALLSVSGVFAALNDSTIYYSFDDADLTGSNPDDLSGNGNNGTNTGATTGVTGQINEAFDFVSINSDYVNTNTKITTTATTIYAWVNIDSSGTFDYFFVQGDRANDRSMEFVYTSTNALRFAYATSSGSAWQAVYDSTSTGLLTPATWHHIAVTRSGTTVKMYVDGSEVTNSLISGTASSSAIRNPTSPLKIGNERTNYYDGKVDEMGIYTRALSATEINDSWDGGTGFNPYAVFPPAAVPLYIPETITETQGASVEINSFTYTPVLSGTFTLLNDTNLSVTATGNILGSGINSYASCEVVFDSVSYGNSSTVAPNARYRALAITGYIGEVAAGTYTATLNCKKDTAQRFDAENFKLIFTSYSNEDGLPLKVENNTFSASITSTTYQPIATFNFTTTNYNTTADILRYISLETTTTNTYTSTGTLCLKGGVVSLGVNSSEYCRYGATGTTGSGSAFDMIVNATNQTQYEFTIYGKSTTADGSVSMDNVNSELITHPHEVNTTELNNLSITSTSYTTLASLDIENADHTTINSVVKASFAVESLSGAAQMTFRLTLSGDSTVNGSVLYRDVSAANQEGLVTIQETFPNLPVGNYTINLQALASNSNSEITGGNMVVFSSNPTIFTANEYNVTLYDRWDNETLTNFSITNEDGTTFTDVGGVVTITATNGFDNLTIIKDGYLNGTILNQNTSQNLNTSIFQAQIQFNAYEIITNTSVSPANFTIDATQVTDSEYFYIKAGTYNVTFSADTYFDKTIEVTISALQNGTLNVTGVSGTVINITAEEIFSSSPVSTFAITISNNNYSYTEDYSTSTGWVAVSAIQDTPFNITINATGYAIQNTTITPNVSLYNYTFSLYTENSILFNLYDEVSGSLLNGTSMTVQVIGTYDAENKTTSNGTVYFDLLTPDDYEIRYYSTSIDDYKLRSYFTTVADQSNQVIDLYALNDTSTEITSATITFVVYDQDLDPVENARVTVSRYYLSENAFLQVFSRDTNTAGQAVGTFETIDAFYQYQVKIGSTIYYTSSAAGTQFTGTQTVPIYINLNTITYDNIQTFDNIPTTLVYVSTSASTGYVQYNWSYSTSLPVCLYVNDVSAFGSQFEQSTCTSGASGSIQIPINTTSLNKEYVAKGTINYNNEGHKVHDTLGFTVNLQAPVTGEYFKDIATFIALMALIMAWFLGIKYPSVSIVIMSAIFVILTLPPLKLITIGSSIAMWAVAVAMVLLFKIRGGQA